MQQREQPQLSFLSPNVPLFVCVPRNGATSPSKMLQKPLSFLFLVAPRVGHKRLIPYSSVCVFDTIGELCVRVCNEIGELCVRVLNETTLLGSWAGRTE